MFAFLGMKVMKVMIQRKRSFRINFQVCNVPALNEFRLNLVVIFIDFL